MAHQPSEMWFPDPRKRRFARWVLTPQGVQIAEVLAGPGSDTSDLPEQTIISPLDPDIAAALDGQLRGDAAAESTIRSVFASLNGSAAASPMRAQSGLPTSSAPASGSGTPSGSRPGQGFRMQPEEIIARVNRIGSALDAREADTQLDSAEQEIVRTLREKGYNDQQIGDIFTQAGPAAQPDITGQGQSADSRPLRMTAADIQAATAQDALTLRASRIGRAERLQRVADIAQRTTEAGDWLTEQGELDRNIRDARQQYETDEAFARSRATEDQNIRWQGNETTHNPGALGQLTQAERQSRERRFRRNPNERLFDQNVAAGRPGHEGIPQLSQPPARRPYDQFEQGGVMDDPYAHLGLGPGAAMTPPAGSFASPSGGGMAGTAVAGGEGGEQWAQPGPAALDAQRRTEEAQLAEIAQANRALDNTERMLDSQFETQKNYLELQLRRVRYEITVRGLGPSGTQPAVIG